MNQTSDIANDYLNKYLHSFQGVDQRFMGYPESPFADHTITHVTKNFSNLLLNNAGDPFDDHGHWKTHTKQFEREVVEFFGELFQFKDYWGYVTSGGTEGNLEGMLVGRNYLRAKYTKELKSIGEDLPIFVTSKASHYSLRKNADILFLELLEIEVNEKDEIDLQDLKEKIEAKVPKERPILMNLNIGTTMRGAIDDLVNVIKLMDSMDRKNVYYHADMALYGLIYRLFYPYSDIFIERICSFAISGHKLLTLQMPSGIFIGKKEYVDVALSSGRVSYIGCMDRTIGGSRNGLLPLLLHAKISQGIHAIQSEIQECITNCNYLYSELRRIGIHCERSSVPGIIVYFPELHDSVNEKYQLACHDGISHVVCMRHVDEQLIDQFINDILAQRKREVDCCLDVNIDARHSQTTTACSSLDSPRSTDNDAVAI